MTLAASISFFHSRDTEAPKVTFPAASHEMFPAAICPDPSLFSFHLVELVIDPSLPSDTLPLRMEPVSIVQPAMLLLEPNRATQFPAEFVA